MGLHNDLRDHEREMRFSDRLIQSAANLYDRTYSPERVTRIERGTIALAIIGFITHLGLIYLIDLGWDLA